MTHPFDFTWAVIKAGERQSMLDLFMTDEERAAMPEVQRQYPQIFDMSLFGDERQRDFFNYTTGPTKPEGMSTKPEIPKLPPAAIIENRGNHTTDFNLVDRNLNEISSIRADGLPEVDFKRGLNTFYQPLSGLVGETKPGRRREGNYRTLLLNLMRQGFPIVSTTRNEKSDSFHRKLRDTLPPDIDSYIDEDENDSYHDRITYYGKPKTSPPEYGDLVEFDVGMLPYHADGRTSYDHFKQMNRDLPSNKLRYRKASRTPIEVPHPDFPHKKKRFEQTRIIPDVEGLIDEDRKQNILNDVGWHKHSSQPQGKSSRFGGFTTNKIPERLKIPTWFEALRQ